VHGDEMLFEIFVFAVSLMAIRTVVEFLTLENKLGN
jgi:hypothetical protein